MMPPDNVNELVELYNSTLSSLLDKHAPLITKSVRNTNPWYTPELRKLKAACRKAERKWRHSHSSVWKTVSNMEYKKYRAAIAQAKQQYYSSLITNASSTKTLWKTVNGLLHRTSVPTFPSHPVASLPTKFASFFSEKVSNLRSSIADSTGTSAHIPNPNPSCESLSYFKPATVEEVAKLILESQDKCCSLDPIPTSLLKKCVGVISPVITKIINLSLSEATVPNAFKHAIVTPLHKKPSLDKEQFSN